MADSSSYLNLPGLKHLQKDSSVNWDEDSSSFISYDGLKRMDRGKSYTNSKKEFLSIDGLKYLVFRRLFFVRRKKKEK